MRLIEFLFVLSVVSLSQARPEILIVNGDVAVPEQFPWHASIHVVRGTGPILYCGGSLISPNFVLTTASHIKNAQIAQIHLGSISFTRPELSFESRTFFIHPQYNRNSFDIGLIQLPQNVIYTKNVLPIRLPTQSHQNQTFVNTTSVISGFGVTDSGSNFLNEQLLFANQTIISNSQCSLSYGGNVIGPDVLCAIGGSIRNQSACYGDNGGALVFNDNGLWTQIGLVSFFPISGCDSGPVGYARISSGLDWISSTASIPIFP